MPVGVAGELWVGGPGVGRGYLNRHDLTAERFRVDRLSWTPGARMYATGDLARWMPDGNIEYLGRVDRQVKLRGYRIEPGEVESVLERHPGVARAVVAVHGTGGLERLVAWVLPAPGPRPEPSELRDFAREHLPAQMVPAATVLVDHLPETPGGKIDIRALPAPDARPAQRGGAARLQDVTGSTLQDCFAAVLKLDEVSPDDSFFDLGGHSLLAMKLIERIDRSLGRRLTLGELHEAPTPRDLAALLHGSRDAAAYEHLLPIQPNGTRPPLFGVHVLGPNAGWYRPLAARLGDDQPVMGLWIANPDVESPAKLQVIAARYADEIDRWCPRGPVGLAGISLGGFVAYELAQQLRARGREVSVLALFDTAGPGGRPQLEGRARARRHLQHLQLDGFDYVRGRVRGKLWKLREKVRATRAARRQSQGGAIPAEMWMSRFVELNLAAAREYEVLPYDGTVTVFRATKVSFDRPEVIEDGLGWGPYAKGGVDVIDVPGDHMSILAEPHVAVMAHHLSDILERRHRPRG
jgi:thioesterase domain-containing protein/acyl carrier protein